MKPRSDDEPGRAVYELESAIDDVAREINWLKDRLDYWIEQAEKAESLNAELLAALKAMVADYEGFWGKDPGGWKSTDQGRAAIAKAERS